MKHQISRILPPICFLLLGMFVSTAQAQTSLGTLNQYLPDFQNNSGESALQGKIITLLQTMKPAPGVAEDVAKCEGVAHDASLAGHREQLLLIAKKDPDCIRDCGVKLQTCGKLCQSIGRACLGGCGADYKLTGCASTCIWRGVAFGMCFAECGIITITPCMEKCADELSSCHTSCLNEDRGCNNACPDTGY
jgi:hypothetical protein